MIVYNTSSLERNVAKLYLLFLGLRMPTVLLGIRSALAGAAIYLDFILHILGLLLLIIHENGVLVFRDEESLIIKKYFGMAIFLDFTSLIMAIIMQLTYGSIGGETAFSGIAGMVVYFLQYGLMLLYNYRVFRILTIEEIKHIIKTIIFFELILGYIQLFTMVFGGAISNVYNSIDFLGFFYDAPMPKLCLSGGEGASAGTIISVFVMPFVYSNALEESNGLKSILGIIVWLPIVFFTRSSTAYILFALVTLIFFIFLIRTPGSFKISFFVFAVFTFFLLSTIGIESNIDWMNQIQYLLFEKATDRTNGSTISRLSDLYVAWGTFLKYPIFGVGNGNQGYFYQELLPAWALNAEGSDVMVFYDLAGTGIANAGTFFPGIISGYGVVGTTLFVSFFIKLIRLMKSKKEEYPYFYRVFIMSFFAILLCGFQGDFYGKYFLWFMLSIPLIPSRKEYELSV